MDLPSIFAISFLITIMVSNVSTNEHFYKIQNLPKDEFVLTKSEVSSDDDLFRRYSKDLGKVSDDVAHFIEKTLRVAKALLRDWLLKNDEAVDARNGKEKDESSDEN